MDKESTHQFGGCFFTVILTGSFQVGPSSSRLWWLTHVMQQYAETFYKSKRWQDTRNAYASSVGGLCELCLAKGQFNAGVIVHHKTHITLENINDPFVTLSWDNLQLLCRDCHAQIHTGTQKRYVVDELGRVTAPSGRE